MKILKNQKGQAVFEFIIFAPFLVLLYTIFYTSGNSLSGAINQQKATRGYFYTLVKNNSYLLSKEDLNALKAESIKSAGFFAISWSEKKQGRTRFAPCFKFASLIRGTSNEECDDSTRPDEGSTTFIRTFIAYGVCGAIYRQGQGINEFEFDAGIQADPLGCTLSQN